ncbi:hypothetical protein [Filifactor alocis]|uniref:hypothetical protein n=1 Tax=Filifactor alocis TaxID=143361 RepID=UPI003F9F3C40
MTITVEKIMEMLSKQELFEAKVYTYDPIKNKEIIATLEFDTLVFNKFTYNQYGSEMCIALDDFDYNLNLTPLSKIVEIIE